MIKFKKPKMSLMKPILLLLEEIDYYLIAVSKRLLKEMDGEDAHFQKLGRLR